MRTTNGRPYGIQIKVCTDRQTQIYQSFAQRDLIITLCAKGYKYEKTAPKIRDCFNVVIP